MRKLILCLICLAALAYGAAAIIRNAADNITRHDAALNAAAGMGEGA